MFQKLFGDLRVYSIIYVFGNFRDFCFVFSYLNFERKQIDAGEFCSFLVYKFTDSNFKPIQTSPTICSTRYPLFQPLHDSVRTRIFKRRALSFDQVPRTGGGEGGGVDPSYTADYYLPVSWNTLHFKLVALIDRPL